MSSLLPHRLRGQDMSTINPTNITTMNVTQSHHSRDGIFDVYGASLIVMALPVFVVMFLFTWYTRHKMQQSQFPKRCLTYFNRMENGNAEDNEKTVGGKKKVRTRKPAFSNGKYNKVRYHQQKLNDSIPDGNKGNGEMEDIGIYNDFYDENDRDCDDEEIDLQKQESVLSTMSTSTLGTHSSHIRSTHGSSSHQVPGSTVVHDGAILHNMMQTMSATLTFQAWMPKPMSPVPATATSSDPKLSLPDEESKDIIHSSISTSSSGTFGGIFRSLWSTPPLPEEETQDTTTSAVSQTKPPAPVKLILQDTTQKLPPHTQYLIEDPDTADFRRHIPFSSVSAPLRSVLVTTATDHTNNHTTVSFASDSEDDESGHGISAFGGHMLQNMTRNDLVTVFDDSQVLQATVASMHPHQQMKLKKLGYSLQL